MTNNKTIITGLIVLAVLGGGVWYASQRDISVAEQAASILGNRSAGNNLAEKEFQTVENEFILGNPEAPVTIIEYTSHFCGHCANFHFQTLPLIVEKYIKTGQVKLIPRRVSPLELGETLLCAQEQGKFWQADGYLFEHSQELIQQTREIASADEIKPVVTAWLKTMAGNLGLDQDSFDQCFDSGKYEERVMNWFKQAEEAELSGTPTFFINNQAVVGNQPYSQFEELIEQSLAQ
jgi:protein-disulfide isomerase